MKRIKGVLVIILAVLLLIPFMASSAGAVNVIRNGDFSSGLAEWVVNSEIDPTWDPVSDGAVSLNPPTDNWEGFMGTIIYQNLNVTDIASKQFTFSMNMLKNNSYSDNTIEVVLIYFNSDGNVHEVDLVNPADADISDTPESPSVVTTDYTFPADAVKLIKIEIEKYNDGDFTADNISLTTTASVVVGQIPAVTGLSASAGAYGSSVTITGSNFGTSTGFVSIGDFSEGVTITSWSDTSITATINEPARSGKVYVVADYVESNINFSFNVTSPHFTVDIMEDDVIVIKGQEAEFVVAVDFNNGFTTTGGITFTLTDLNGTNFTNSGFSPVLLNNEGGTLLKINTSSLTAGMYPLLLNAFKDGSATPYCSAPLDLEVVTVSDIKFYEWDETSTIKTYITEKAVTAQGFVSINYEILDSSGDELFFDISITQTSSDSSKLVVYANDWGEYNIDVLDSGSATLTATAPDGFSKTLTVNINIPESPRVTSATIDGLSLLTITNKDTATHVFSATGTESIGYGSSGLIYLQTDEVIYSDANKTITRQFTVDVDNNNKYAPLGTTLFYAFTTDSNGNYTAKRVVPLTITNDSSYSAISGGVKIIDSGLPSYAAEHFTLEFYNAASGSLSFSREFHSYHGGGKFISGAIPPGTYKIRCTGGEYGEFQPQWYPNASSLSNAMAVEFTASNTIEDIYFFLRSVPASIWTEQNSGVTQTLYGINFINASTGWAVGGNGISTTTPDPVIVKTTDGGETWVNQTTATITKNLYSCYFVDENNGWAVGGSASGPSCTIYHTTDGGQTWTGQTSQTSRRPTTVFFTDQSNGWICGDGGTIQHTTDGGTTWVLQTTPTFEHICGIRFVDANNGWAGAQHGVIIHTTDGGTTWTQQTSTVEGALSSFDKRHFGSMDFVHTDQGEDKGWIVGIDGTIVHTDDGGVNWAVQSSNTTEELWAVDFIDSQHGVVVGANGLILRTADGGVTWTAKENGSDKTLIHVCAADQDTAWAVGAEGTILKYGGEGDAAIVDNVWTNYTGAVMFGETGEFNPKVNAIARTSDGTMIFGTDVGVAEFDGITWTHYQASNNYNWPQVKAVAVDNAGVKWFGLQLGGVSVFDGSNWIYHDPIGGINSVNDIAIDNNNHIWLATDGGFACYDGADWTVYTMENSELSHNQIFRVDIAPDGKIWMGTNGGGINVFDGSNWINYTTSDGLGDNTIYNFAFDNAGNVYIAPYFGGIDKFDGDTGSICTSHLKNIYFSEYVKSVAIDLEGKVWATYDNGNGDHGVCRFDGTNWPGAPSDWTIYTTDDGLGCEYVRCKDILMTPDGAKWFGTWHGVSRLGPTGPAPVFLKGDINNDTNINLADAILTLQVIVGLNPTGIYSGADINSDGKVGLSEVVYILQHVAGLR